MVDEGHRIRAASWLALRAAGLWPDWGCYESGRALIVEWGEREMAFLRATVGRRRWSEAFRRVPRGVRDSDIVRILGVGRLLTEYVIAPLNVAEPQRAHVSRLGALANLIVTIFDHYADTTDGRCIAVARESLVRGERRPGWLLPLRVAIAGTPEERFMTPLVRLYYRQLEELVSHAASAAPVLELIQRAIVRMYDAESLTWTGSPPRAVAMRRKAALPFVVMGLPGWLAASPARADLPWHLRWLYRLGIFFGNVDDVVDLEADRASGHPNRIGAQLAGHGGSDEAIAVAAARIARRAEALVRDWRERVPHPPPNPAIASAIEITTCSWFGGIGWQPGGWESVHAAS